MRDAESADLSAEVGSPAGASRRVPPAWVIGAGFIPLGLVYGFTITALPYLLTRMGIRLDRAAEVSATVMSPTFWAFLVNPLLDTGLTRRTYCWITVLVSGISMAAALWWLSPQHLGVTTLILLIGEFSMVLYGSAVGVCSRILSRGCGGLDERR